MKVLSKEKSRVLAARYGWSLAQAEGYVDGETFRRRGMKPSSYVRIGIDEYSLGFRAGYYERKNPESVDSAGRTDTPDRGRWNAGRS